MSIIAKPFLKWAGGKTQLLSQLAQYYPAELRNGTIRNYVEPFLGGGAVFLALAQQYHFSTVFLSDTNVDLIGAYLTIQQNLEPLLEVLANYQTQYEQYTEPDKKHFFLAIRDEFNTQRNQTSQDRAYRVQRTAQLIFLNKTCFNGLFRLNSKGEFNVPFGRYSKPTILDQQNLIALSEILQPIDIQAVHYSACWDRVDEQTFVYLDPPYRPLSRTAHFNQYSGEGFDDTEQIRLASFCRRLSVEKKAKIMLSNSDPKNLNPDDNFFEEIYQDFNIRRIEANRMINSKAEKRGRISELLITNY